MKIFVVEDEMTLRVILSDELREAGHEVSEFLNAKTALKSIEKERPDIVISDMRIPGMSGLKLLEKIKNISPDTQVVIMTAYSTVDTAVKALKMGAFDYICKPFNIDEIHHIINKARELHYMKLDNQRLQSEISKQYEFSNFISENKAIKAIFETIKSVIDSNASILISGETGTGKELLANIIHYNSNRSTKPFIKVSCACLTRDIFESELFGYENGVVGNTAEPRKGRFESANEGTIFLDDIDDIPLDLQVKLLRVIEEQELEPVGSSITKKIDVRVISSSKNDLKSLINEGKFRSDLYYRLNVIPVHIPPLREHPDDIEILAKSFLENFCRGKKKEISNATIELLKKYHWPGNIRELKNLIDRLCLTTNGSIIQSENIPTEFLITSTDLISNKDSKWNLEEIIIKTEATLIKTAIAQNNGNKTKAAKLLGIPLSTLRSKLAKLKLE
ncbi:MAG: sigma-54-dependent transcriptional regulator [Bacteroidota bacterium]